MRRVVASLFISLDGVVESPEQWQFDGFDMDMLQEMSDAIGKITTILLGRVLYEEWAPYWPTATDEPFASFINNTDKVVVSTTLDSVAWGDKNNISLIKSDVENEIQKLKQQDGGDIGLNGPTLIRRLLEADLIDELTLLVHPVVASHGKRLFSDSGALKRLKLIRSRTTGAGVAVLAYAPLRG